MLSFHPTWNLPWTEEIVTYKQDKRPRKSLHCKISPKYFDFPFQTPSKLNLNELKFISICQAHSCSRASNRDSNPRPTQGSEAMGGAASLAGSVPMLIQLQLNLWSECGEKHGQANKINLKEALKTSHVQSSFIIFLSLQMKVEGVRTKGNKHYFTDFQITKTRNKYITWKKWLRSLSSIT